MNSLLLSWRLGMLGSAWLRRLLWAWRWFRSGEPHISIADVLEMRLPVAIPLHVRYPTAADGCVLYSDHGEDTPSILVWCPGGGGYWTVAWWNCDKKDVSHWLPLRRPETT